MDVTTAVLLIVLGYIGFVYNLIVAQDVGSIGLGKMETQMQGAGIALLSFAW